MMMSKLTWLYPLAIAVSILATLLSMGCAGPSTPLGAPWATSSSDVRNGPLSFIASLFDGRRSTISFLPARQNLHGAAPMTVVVRDPAGVRSNYKLVVRHNGLDITTSFMRQADVTVAGDALFLRVPLVRLPADREHLIEVVYGSASGLNAYARYEPPLCNAFGSRELASVDGFSPSRRTLEEIRRQSRTHKLSPAFTAGLIAQESGFNPRTVSWAKAIGLTQVTALAEQEIATQNSDWPRYPGINELPALFVQALVLSGHANSGNEWRLDPTRSIDGGLTYLSRLASRWSEPENIERVKSLTNDVDAELTRLVLASYNSGFARVAQALSRHGANWLAAPELREARKYVNRIVSYCDSFSGETI